MLTLLRENQDVIGFGVATGRTIDSARAHLEKKGVQFSGCIISSVGSEIYYGKEMHYGSGWDTHISAKWDRKKIVKLLKDLSFLTYQEEKNQRSFKLSYNMNPDKDRLAMIHERLLNNINAL